MGTVLSQLIDEIEGLTNQAEIEAQANADAIGEKFMTKAKALTDQIGDVDPERVAQELAMLAIKADVREEVDRLKAHINMAREYLKKDHAIGRKLDFLMQEFNREANTLCSKSSSVALTEVGLSLKTSIDQLREQIQNVE